MGKSWNLVLVSGIITMLYMLCAGIYMTLDVSATSESVTELFLYPTMAVMAAWIVAGGGFAIVAGIVIFLMLWLIIFLLIVGFWNLVKEITKPKPPA